MCWLPSLPQPCLPVLPTAGLETGNGLSLSHAAQMGVEGLPSRDGRGWELFPQPSQAQAGQSPASGQLGRVPALASSLDGPDILPAPPPALCLENGPFVGSGLDRQLTWLGCSSWQGPGGGGCLGQLAGPA